MPRLGRHTDQMRDTTAALEADLSGFCEAAYPRLVGALVLQCGDPAVAEELAQDTLVRVIDRWDQVRAMDYPMSWAHRVGYNLAASHFRRRSAERRAYRRHAARDVSGATTEVDGADAIAIRRAVARLPERERCALVLRYFGDLPVAAVAESMGVTAGSVKVFTSRALAKLRADLGIDQLTRGTAPETDGLDHEGLAGRARRREVARRVGGVLTVLIAIAVAVSIGVQLFDRAEPPEIITPDELRDASWGPGAAQDFPPVLNAFLPTPPVVESHGMLWTTATTGATLIERAHTGDPTGRSVSVGGAQRTVCYLEATADQLLLAVLCDDAEAGRSPAGLALIDPEDVEVLAAIDRPGWNSVGDNVEHAQGAIWTAGREQLTRIDPADGSSRTFPLPQGARPRALASGAGSLWLTTESLPDTVSTATGELIRVDPETGRVENRIPLGDASSAAGAPAAVKFTPWTIATARDAVWVELAGEGRIARIDPVTGVVGDHIDVGPPTTAGRTPTAAGRSEPIAATGNLWVRTGDRALLIDPDTGRVLATVVAPVSDPSQVSGTTVTRRGDVWFGDWERDVVWRVPALAPTSSGSSAP